MSISIAIDGPAGAGKSTIAKEVSKRLGFTYIDTGAMYRAITLGCVKLGFNPLIEEKTVENLHKFHVELTNDGKVFLNGEDVSSEIRTEKISKLTSPVSAIRQVREYLVAQQKQIAVSQNVVMDGRDIGTNVLPNAQVKIFMVASPKVRAERRWRELKEKGIEVTLEEVLEDIIQRDFNDTHRKFNPLMQAEDAILMDTSDMSIQECADKILEIIKEKVGDLVEWDYLELL